MTYNVGLDIEYVPVIGEVSEFDDVALVLMNATFPKVKEFSKVLPFGLVARNAVLKCTTVGFSFIGRNLERPTPPLLKPMAFEIDVSFGLKEVYE